jgi:hypothetical protein
VTTFLRILVGLIGVAFLIGGTIIAIGDDSLLQGILGGGIVISGGLCVWVAIFGSGERRS